MIESVVDAIGYRTVREERGEAAPAGVHEIVRPANVEEAFVLPRETRGRQILGGCRTTHADRDISTVFPLEFSIRFRHLPAQILLIRGGIDDGARRGGASGEIRNPPLVDPGK